MHVALAVSGTYGDVLPMLALAVGLREAGHSVTLTAPPNFAAESAQFGVPFHPCGRDMQAFLEANRARVGANPVKMARLAKTALVEDISEQFRAVRVIASGADVVVWGGMMYGARSIAESMSLRCLCVVYTPDAIPSAFHPPFIVPRRTLPRVINRIGWRLFGDVQNWLVRDACNRERAALGLAPLRDCRPYLFDRGNTVLATDPPIADLPPDCADMLPPVGSWQIADPRPLGDVLAAFLADGPEPVYFGFGSMPDDTPERTTSMFAEVAERVGCRAIISAGWARLGGIDLGPRILSVGSVPHAKLFPRVAAVVHHGGAGTTHAAARAGVPQVMVPHMIDQFGWAERMQERGVAPTPLERTRLSAPRLAERVAVCLRDRAMQHRARALGAAARKHDGVRAMVRLLEGRSSAG